MQAESINVKDELGRVIKSQENNDIIRSELIKEY